MSTRTVFAALLFLAALALGSLAHAIEEDQVIDPAAKKAVEESADESMDGIFSKGSSTGMLMTLLGYVVILGALCVVAWFLFKKGFFRKSLKKGEGKLKVAETRMLGNRQFIMVVEYEDQKILLGVGPGKIDYLTNLSSYRGDFPSIGPGDAKNRGGME